MPQELTKEVGVSPQQMQFHESCELTRGFVGGINSGKSYVGALDILLRAKPNRLYMCLAPTYPMLRDASWRTLNDVGRNVLNIIKKSNRSEMLLTLTNGAEIMGRTSSDPERMRGPNLSGLWMDEASLMGKDAYEIGIGRLREGGEMGWLSATFTPKGKKHWTYDVFTGADSHLTTSRSGDNVFAAEQFESFIRSRYSSQMARQELDGEFLDLEGAVFKAKWFEHRWEEHADGALRLDGCRTVMANRCKVFMVCDPAASEKKTADYTAAGVFLITPTNDMLILDFMRERLDIEKIIPKLKLMSDRWNPAFIACEANGFQIAIVREGRRTPGMPPFKELTPEGKGKLVRATEAIVRAESGQVFLPVGPRWVTEFLDEVLCFTGTDEDDHDDQVDCLTYAAKLQGWGLDQTRQGSGGIPRVHQR